MNKQHHAPINVMGGFEKVAIMLVTVLPGALLMLALVYTARQVGADPLLLDESDLNADGIAYEINADQDGFLWISDYSANEIRQVDPVSGVYTTYLDLYGPSDARRDGAGNIWWTDFDNNRVGRIAFDTVTATTWSLTGSGVAWGTAFDGTGRLWMTDFFDSLIFRFDPADSKLCTYTMPGESASEYLVAHAGDIWLGDGLNERILRFDPSANLFTSWQLAPGAYPRGLSVTGDGDLWWADSGLGLLAELQPDISQMTTYTLPLNSEPDMIALSNQRLWYSGSGNGTIGALDPAAASGVTSILPVSEVSASAPDCTILQPETETPVVTETGIASWSPVTYTTAVDGDGWKVYELPVDSSPWGIAAEAGHVWVVDNGRQVLSRIPSDDSFSVYLPAIQR